MFFHSPRQAEPVPCRLTGFILTRKIIFFYTKKPFYIGLTQCRKAKKNYNWIKLSSGKNDPDPGLLKLDGYFIGTVRSSRFAYLIGQSTTPFKMGYICISSGVIYSGLITFLPINIDFS